MTATLKLAKNLALPLHVASETICDFGLRGSGKTNTAGAFAEELLDNNHPIVVIDPTDAWWGLRAGRDGSPGGGYSVFIFGGSHADLPLNETDGKTIAEFVVHEQVPVILSLRHLRKAAQRRFVTEFCEELYHLKGKDQNRTPLTVFIDEAPLFVPQKVMGEVARTVGAVEDLIARGRNAGFGVVLISQRSATLNADVRTQADTIICHRVTSPLDRKAIADWFEENATAPDLKAILHSLATLKNGEAWVWSPSNGIMERVQMRLRRTYDSSATPKAGESIRPPRKLADVDLEKLKGRLSASIEKARQDDPRELRRRIAELEKQVKAAPTKSAPPVVERVEVPMFDREAFKELEALTAGEIGKVAKDIADDFRTFESNAIGLIKLAANNARGALHTYMSKALQGAGAKPGSTIGAPRRTQGAGRVEPVVMSRVAPERQGKVATQLDRRLLTAMAQYPQGRERSQILAIAGYSDAGRISTAFARFREDGWVDDEGKLMRITDRGLTALGSFSPLPTGDDLVRYWINKLDRPANVLLSVLNDNRGAEITRADLLSQAKFADAGRISSALAMLRRLDLMRDGNAGMALNEETFS